MNVPQLKEAPRRINQRLNRESDVDTLNKTRSLRRSLD
jgi:hypothetical protein